MTILCDMIYQWRQALLTALDGHGSLLIGVIPGLRSLIGDESQPSSPPAILTPSESQILFQRTFTSFVSVFATSSHPLILALDDLQWVDQQSLDVIHMLFCERKLCLLIIGAYRENEVSDAHPLIITLKQMAEEDQQCSKEKQVKKRKREVVQTEENSILASSSHPSPSPPCSFSPSPSPIPPSFSAEIHSARIHTISLLPLTLSDVTQLCASVISSHHTHS